MNNKVKGKYASFTKELSLYFQQPKACSKDSIVQKTKALFDRAFEVKITANLSSGRCKKELKTFGFIANKELLLLSPGVYSFMQQKRTKKFFEETLLLMLPILVDPLKTLAGVYNSYYGDDTRFDNLFTLMLEEGKNWPKKAESLQLAVCEEVDLREGRIIGFTSLVVIALLMNSYLYNNLWLWATAVFTLVALYASLGVEF